MIVAHVPVKIKENVADEFERIAHKVTKMLANKSSGEIL